MNETSNRREWMRPVAVALLGPKLCDKYQHGCCCGQCKATRSHGAVMQLSTPGERTDE